MGRREMGKRRYIRWYALAVNDGQENICAEFNDAATHLLGNFLHRTNATVLIGLGIVLLSFAGCSRTCGSEIYVDVPDLSPRKVISYYMEQGGGQFPTEELQVGKGRIAQPGRKMRIRVQAADSEGNSYGSGSVSFLDPPFAWQTWGPGVDSGTVPQEFMAAMAGMREGGVRKFTLPMVPIEYVNAITELSDGESHHTIIQYPRGREIIFNVTLEKVCKPKFCSLLTYAIIDVGKSRTSRETSCR